MYLYIIIILLFCARLILIFSDWPN